MIERTRAEKIKLLEILVNHLESNYEELTKEEKQKVEEAKKVIADYFASDDALLPCGFEWCRKAKYEVLIELGCYKIDEKHPLRYGFVEKEIDGERYAIKKDRNFLEKNNWETNPNRPYVISGTVGERWPIKPSNLTAYEVNPEDIGINPTVVSTKDPDDQEFLVAYQVPVNKKVKVVTKWAFRDDGTLDESQVLIANADDSPITHCDGDYVVAKHIDGKPEYMELSEEERNTKEAATLYSPRIINGLVMDRTYDHAETKADIKKKYKKSPKTLTKKESE